MEKVTMTDEQFKQLLEALRASRQPLEVPECRDEDMVMGLAVELLSLAHRQYTPSNAAKLTRYMSLRQEMITLATDYMKEISGTEE